MIRTAETLLKPIRMRNCIIQRSRNKVLLQQSKTYFSALSDASKVSHTLNNNNNKTSTVLVNNGIHASSEEKRMDYVRGWAFQQTFLDRRLQAKRRHANKMEGIGSSNKKIISSDDEDEGKDEERDNDRDRILLFEHEHVYTLGRGADEGNLSFLDNEIDGGAESRRRLKRGSRDSDSCRIGAERLNTKANGSIKEIVDSMTPIDTVRAPNGAPIYRIERGGEVTYHGPGQLVVYPLLDLQRHPYKKDLHWYLRCIEEVVIKTLEEYGIHGKRDEINTGVWVNTNKIAAVGLSSARWITTHGFAININPDLNMFDSNIIIPCGIEGRGVTSIARELQRQEINVKKPTPRITDVAQVVLDKVEEVFRVPVKSGENLV